MAIFGRERILRSSALRLDSADLTDPREPGR